MLDGIFSANFTGEPFVFFSTLHIVTLLALAFLNAAILLGLKRVRGEAGKKRFRYMLAAVLLALEAGYELWSILAGVWSANLYLPLQLCDISLILASIMLINKNRLLYEITYFIGIGGSLQALLTPDFTPYSYPHFTFFAFFLTHGLTITAVLYMTVIEGYRPKPRSVAKTFAFVNLYAALIFGLNFLIKGNYLFLRQKPDTPSLLDLLGPWPWYVLSLEGVSLVIFLILYLPFPVLRLFQKRRL